MKPHYPNFQNFRTTDYRTNNTNMPASTVTLLQEIFSIYNLGFVCVKSSTGDGYLALLAWHDLIPSGLELTGLGERFRRLFMGGGSIELTEILSVANSLR